MSSFRHLLTASAVMGPLAVATATSGQASTLPLAAAHASVTFALGPVENQAGSLRQLILDYPIPSADSSNKYESPTGGEVDAFRTVVDDILAGEFESAATIAATLNYQTILFSDTDYSTDHIVLVELPPESSRKWRGVFAFSQAPRSRRRGLVFQAPHPLYDLNTKAEATDLYLATGATALIIAGAHRNNLSASSPCSGDYRLSDMAHVTASFFQAAHEQLHLRRLETVAISVHGMSTPDPPHDVSVSNGTTEDIGGESLSKEIAAEMNRILAMDADDERLALSHQDAGSGAVLAGTTNTQGRFSNGSTDPCTVSVNSAIQPERFIHMEQTRAVRDSAAQYGFVIRTYQNLFDFLEPACSTAADCDDGDPCTADRCETTTGCANDPIVPCCGNASCENGEDCITCPADCVVFSEGFCGDGICAGSGYGEDCFTCSDCRCSGGATCKNGCCGDGNCSGNENARNCPIDCEPGFAAPHGDLCCGDLVCDAEEDACGCPIDCGSPPATETICNDGLDGDCDGVSDCADSDCAGDPACEIAGFCGDGVCDGSGEDCFSCPGDCRCSGGRTCKNGCCGDGVCSGSENSSNCAVDCGS